MSSILSLQTFVNYINQRHRWGQIPLILDSFDTREQENQGKKFKMYHVEKSPDIINCIFDEMWCKNVFVSILPGWMSVITFSRGDRNILKYSVILVYFLSLLILRANSLLMLSLLTNKHLTFILIISRIFTATRR